MPEMQNKTNKTKNGGHHACFGDTLCGRLCYIVNITKFGHFGRRRAHLLLEKNESLSSTGRKMS